MFLLSKFFLKLKSKILCLAHEKQGVSVASQFDSDFPVLDIIFLYIICLTSYLLSSSGFVHKQFIVKS